MYNARVATYAALTRVSHMGDRKAEGESFHSDRDQLEAIERWALGQGVELDVLPAELDVSGGLPIERRPSLMRAIEGVETGVYAGVVVAYLTRFGRNLREQLRAWDRIEAAGGRVVVVQEGIDTSNSSGRMHRNILLSIAEGERERHAEDFERRRRCAVEAGIWQRRQTPRGYDRDPETRRLVPNADSPHVVQAFRDKAAGKSNSELARLLGMTTSGVRQLLRNRVYLGELKVGQHVNAAAHPSLVGVDLFESAQRATARPPRAKSENVPALLAGLVRCAACGHVMSRAGRSDARAYTCQANHSGAKCPAPAAVAAGKLDAYVEQIAVAELERLAVIASAERRVESARTDLARADADLRAYLTAISPLDVGEDAFAEGARGRRDAVDAARRRLGGELARAPQVPGIESGGDAWGILDGHARNALLRSLLAAVVVRRAGGRGVLIPLAERVRVLAFGAEVRLPRRTGHEGAGIVPIPFPPLDHESVLREPGSELRSERSRGTRQVAVAA